MRLLLRRPHWWPSPVSSREALQPVVCHEVGHRLGLVVEPLHPHQRRGAVVERRPPRSPVALPVAGGGTVHVGRDDRHLVLAVDAGDVQEAGRLDEGPHLLDGIVEGEPAAEVERPTVCVGEGDVTGGVRGRAVERGPDDEPPVEDVGQAPALDVECAAREPAHRRDLVDRQVGQLLGAQAEVHRAGGGRGRVPHDGAVAVGDERPAGGAVDLDGERPERQVGQRRSEARRGRLERGRQLVAEERVGIGRGDRTVNPGADVDGHGVSQSTPRPVRQPFGPAAARSQAGWNVCLNCSNVG